MQLDSTDILAKMERFVSSKKRNKSFYPLHLPSFAADPRLNQGTSFSPLSLPSVHQRVLSLAPNSAQHRTRTSRNTNDNLPSPTH